MRIPLLCALLLAPSPGVRADAPLGFFASSLEGQRAAEREFMATPSPAKARQWSAWLTEEPHVAGTPQQRRVAEYLAERLRAFGIEAELVRYDVFLNYPKRVALRLTEPVETELALIEDFHARDKDSAGQGVLPGFHGYGASGRASGQVVYANYGTREDYDHLEQLGVSVDGRVVLARYGRVFRGLKVWEAEKRGAAGVVLYSDPADDGYMQGDPYPEGPMRPPSAIQRGSVQFLSLQPGDPSTPGYASVGRARRVPRDEMRNAPRIPSLPIGYGEAEKVLRLLGGPRVPDDWQGGLPFAYHLGPGGASLALEVEMDEGLRPIFNVIGRIPGSDQPDRWVILGNHADAWTFGAADPNSGTASWLETARALGAARRAGWQPRRTIVLASWDAEEYGLVGSTEWGEALASELAEKTVAYVNLDSSVTGSRLRLGGTPSLRDLAREVAAAVPEPLEGDSVAAAWETAQRRSWAREAPVDLDRPGESFEPRLAALGSGSDYTVFLDHLGIPCLNFNFSGSYGVYHSMYDNLYWMESFGDPRFVYHAVAARFYGLLAMRLAGADVVPLRFASYARVLRRDLDQLRRKAVRAARQPASPDSKRPAALEPDFSSILAALDELEAAGASVDASGDRIVSSQDRSAAARLNESLIRIERAFTDGAGLPGRPWFRHLLYAPGLTTGYAPWPFPELAQAVEERDAEMFERGAQRVLTVLTAATDALRGAATGAVASD